MSKKKITIREIASLAKVSPATVSMILNEKSIQRFSNETVELVRRIARENHYHLKHMKNTHGKILIICPSIMNPYYATLIQSIEQEATTHGYSTTICTTYWNADVERTLLDHAIHSSEIVGIIFSMIPQRPELAKEASAKIPIVAVGDRQEDLGIDTVDVNNYQAGQMVGRHLIELGHKQVAFISSALNEEHTARVRRYEGLKKVYRDCTSEGSVTVYSADITSYRELNTTEIEHEIGYQLTQKCLDSTPEVTALVAVNDMVAYGVLDALAERGLQVPESYSVCAFDNIFPSQFYGMSLTTIEHSIVERGRSTLRLLLDHLNQESGNFSRNSITRVEFKSRLIVRRTTGPARKTPLAVL